jgi:hypothetical protein
VKLVSFTFRTVSFYFFGNVQVVHYQLSIKETYLFLYFMTLYIVKSGGVWLFWVCFYYSSC